jgi:hypothetical protein
MKRTDQERIAREIGRQQKKDQIREKRISNKEDISVAGYAKQLEGVFMWDDETIYNVQDDTVLEVLMAMKEDLSDKECEAALKRAIKRTQIKDRDNAFDEAMLILQEA